MKHLRLFKTESDFDVLFETLEKPWIIFAQEDLKVHYSSNITKDVVIIFKDYDGTIISQKNYFKGDLVLIPEIMLDNYPGYKFIGWGYTPIDKAELSITYIALYEIIPKVTIDMEDSYMDTSSIAMNAIKTATVIGELTFSITSIPSDVYHVYENAIIFDKHYEGNLTITASALDKYGVLLSDSKTIRISCNSAITTTCQISEIYTPSVDAKVTSAIINYSCNITTTHAGKSTTITTNNSKTVTFEANTSYSDVVRKGSFYCDHGELVEWQVNLKGKLLYTLKRVPGLTVHDSITNGIGFNYKNPSNRGLIGIYSGYYASDAGNYYVDNIGSTGSTADLIKHLGFDMLRITKNSVVETTLKSGSNVYFATNVISIEVLGNGSYIKTKVDGDSWHNTSDTRNVGLFCTNDNLLYYTYTVCKYGSSGTSDITESMLYDVDVKYINPYIEEVEEPSEPEPETPISPDRAFDIEISDNEGVYVDEILNTNYGSYFPGALIWNGGLSIYDNLAYFTFEKGYIAVVNLDTKEVVSSGTLASYSTQNHSGTTCFSNTIASTGIPYLYISECRDNVSSRCFVEKVNISSPTFSSELVQTINYVGSKFAIAWNYVVDGNYLWLFGYPAGLTSSDKNNYNGRKLALKFELPNVTMSTINLDDSMILDEFEFTMNGCYQGIACDKGIVALPYSYQGTASAELKPSGVHIMNLDTHEVITDFDVRSYSTKELEGATYYNGDLYVNFHLLGVNNANVLMVKLTYTISEQSYVDLGLPSGLKWATCNLGANSSEEFGYKVQWASTKDNSQSSCNLIDVPYHTADSEYRQLYGWTKYTPSSGWDAYNCTSDGLTTLMASDDIVTKMKGSDWRMPTKKDILELLDNTTITSIVQKEVSCLKFQSKNNSKYLVMPKAGIRGYNSSSGENSVCTIWTSDKPSSRPESAYALAINYNSPEIVESSREWARSIRGVKTT